jgi:PAS domain S-box-containing protein
MRPRDLPLRHILLLITGGLTLMIVAFIATGLYNDGRRLAEIRALRDATLLSNQLFDAAEKLSLERDLALSMLSTEDPDTLADLRPRLIDSREQADAALNAALASVGRYQFTELAELRQRIDARFSEIRVLRPQIDGALALPLARRSRGLAERWGAEATSLLTETETLWVAFVRPFTAIDPVVTQHLRYMHLLRTIVDYAGRERSLVGQLIARNVDATPEQTARLLRGEGVVELSWRFSRVIAEQSGLYATVEPYFNDAKSHYDTLQGMLEEMFYVPGARYGGGYLIDADLWFELSTQAFDSLTELRSASRAATQAYVDRLIADTETAMAGRTLILVFALLLCALSFWVVISRVIRPINEIVDALVKAMRGEDAPFNFSAQRRDEIGKLAEVLVAFRRSMEDVSRTAAELDRSQSRLRAVVDYAVDGLITFDAMGRVTSFNPACERIFGFKAEEMIGNDLKAVLPGLNRSGAGLGGYVASNEARALGATGHEVVAHRKDGTSFPADLSVSAYTLDGRRHFAGIVRDITLRKQADQTVMNYMHALERSNKELDDFAYIASHDLKEPLRGIHNHSRFLREDNADKLDEESVKRVERLVYLSQRMERLVNDLLYFSRLGRQELAVQETDLVAVVADIEETLEHFLEERGAKISVPNGLPVYTCDKPRVTELFRNLITNAIKYNDKPAKLVELGFLRSHVTQQGARMENVFYVKDNGCGIDPEFHEEIFRIFKRLQPQSGPDDGTGVGLTFVKKIVERHGGAIWLESTPGLGTTFYFTLEAMRDDGSLSSNAA